MVSNANQRTIEELLALDIHTNKLQFKILITCKATIEMIDVSIGWWYKACPHCKSST
uniref:Uncharacterized protein n=1 Tax=Manihot esculenta TaxID=3983 RepID=A0A199U9N2_MANES